MSGLELNQRHQRAVTAQKFMWLAKHVGYFRQGLKHLSEASPGAQFELPTVARHASRLDPRFISERRVGDRVLAVVSRTSTESIVERRERGYLDRGDWARRIMKLVVGVGEAESDLISPTLLDDGYGRGPNEDGCVYRPVSDPAVFDRPFSQIYLPHLSELAQQTREPDQLDPSPATS